MKSKVCYNLYKSEFFTIFKHHTFYFSSQFNKDRFDKKLTEYIETETSKLNSKYGCIINGSEVVIALHYYTLIEKRGFYVVKDGLPISKYYTAEMVVV